MIIDHPTIKTAVKLNWYEPAQVVQCDGCKVLARKTGCDAGEAADKARKCGFATKPGATPTSPRLWCCPNCKG